jgi:hypothetical protein
VTTRQAARRYTELQLAVFPLHPVSAGGRCACGDRACAVPGKHPATSRWQNTIPSPRAVDGLWAHPRERGIGLACGPASGCFVLDNDPRHGGTKTLARLQDEHGPLPDTWTAQTGGGGTHHYFAWPDSRAVRNSAGLLGPGLDIRGQGGYVVLPPSLHATGTRYTWTRPPTGPPAPAPAWLLELTDARPARGDPITDPAAGTGMIAAGQRHRALIRFCGLLRSMGLGEQAIVDCGHALLTHHCAPDPPMDMAHAERSMRDIARRYPPTRPR